MANDSLVKVWTGSRGSGKSLSMAYDLAMDMLRGRKVYSNMEISFDYQQKEGSRLYSFRSLPLDMESLYVLDSGVQGCIVAIDEVNLWADSWSWQNVASRLLSIVFQQIRKRSLSFYLTCQNFQWLNTRLRWQTDLHTRCFDWSHGHEGVEPGALIKQTLYDMSGFFTGYAFSEDHRGYDPGSGKNVAERLGFMKPYWGIYNTLNIFTPDEYNTKYKEVRETKLITGGQVVAFDSPSEVGSKVRFVADCMKGEGIKDITIPSLRDRLSGMGVNADLRQLGRFLKDAGFTFKQSRKGNFYSLEDNFGEALDK